MATTTLQIPLTNSAYKNVEGEELNDRDALLANCYVDELGYLRRRPGLLLFKDLTSTVGVSNYPVNGVFWWKNKEWAMVCAYGKVLKVTYASGYITVTDLTTNGLELNRVPTFCNDGTYAFFANGGKIIYTDGSTNTAFIADADCPITVTHIDWLDGYLLATDGTNKFFWSDVNTPLSWNALNFASAAGNADVISALKVFQREIYLFGISSVEVWQNDGVTPFSRQTFYEVGCAAPYSVVTSDQAIYWLSDTRRVVKLANGTLSPISTPYDRDIAGYTSVSDCRASRIVIDGKSFLVFNFPAADKTLVYSLTEEKWHEWNYFNVETGEVSRFRGESLCWCPAWGVHLVGDKESSLLYEMTPEAYTDNGEVIQVRRLTGHIDYGTDTNKRSESVSFRAKRGIGGIERDPKLAIRWNVDNRGFSPWREVSLGEEGRSEISMKLHRLGMFRTKQYEMIVTDAVPVALGDFRETITTMRS